MVQINPTEYGPWALVTGASSGLGEEFARQLAASGLNLVLVARREHILEQLGRELSHKHGIDYRVISLDLTRDDFIDVLEDATSDLDLGLVISNAGVPVTGDFITTDRAKIMASLRLKVVTHLNIAHHFGNRLAQRGYGGLLIVSSMGGLQGVPYVASTAAAEAYALSLGEALHIELKRYGVNVTVLLPGPTNTPGLAKMGFPTDKAQVKLMSAQQCVAEGLNALNARRATHIAGRMNRLRSAILPRSITTRMMGYMMGKIFAPEAIS